ncbi:penicillin-binding protein 1A [Flavisolibacter ginsenosidimutans]|uniref:Penicillin-binding protein n=1 Tax=Flavisolibacter ginsenosidimutans TaxID=661481 RepID=A0A5B8UNT4_9BACT|nr:transglycosylase domain-containing protein [Flavisolibacter ginsenosidimutans]QEC58341.1 penicillin-binding protein [Flavisolibacter ginsenosidimutans]
MKKGFRIFWILFFSGFGAFVIFIMLCVFGVFGKLPSLKELENPSILQSSEVFAADGTLMGKYYVERGNRSSVAYRDISPHVINALISTEDERFYEHSGIDFKRTFSAIASLGRNGGGSTITQQLAKALLDQGSKNKAWRVIEKFKEYIVAIRLERNFTKEEIVALYLNAVPYGDNIYGIKNAARTYFQKEPYELTVDESALLVGLLRGNSIYNPRIHPKEAKERRNVVLGQMVRNEKLSEAEAARYKALPIKLNYKKLDQNEGYAPYFREVLRNQVADVLKGIKNADGEEYSVYKDGLKIYTTINPRMQDYAEEAVAQQMPILQKALNSQRNIRTGSVWEDHQNVLDAAMKNSDRWRAMKDEGLGDKDIKATFYVKVPMKIFAWNIKREKDTVMTPMDSIKYHRQMMQTGFIAMDPVTGEVKAWVGGIGFKTFKLDHAQLDVKRQVGSSIKPLLYCQAIEERGMSPESTVIDEQQSFGKGQLVPATSKSCTGRSMPMASALAYSRNCATAYIMKQVGPAQFANFLERIQIPTKVEPYPSIALGSCDLSLYEMLWGYTIFAGGGFSTKPTFITRIEDRNGNAIYRTNIGANRKQVVSEATAYKMCKMMEGPVTVGTAKGLMQALDVKEMGGKTGTTNDNADAWFMGYTPQLLAGVWVGCDDRFIRIESAQGYGGTAARPIFQAFFKKTLDDKNLALDKQATFPVPADLQNEITNADIMEIIPKEDDAQGDNQNMSADDYTLDTTSYQNMKPESEKPVSEEDKSKPKPEPKKDTSNKRSPAIGSAPEAPKEKKGFFKKLFGGNKDKDKEQQKPNDY